jgi:DNA repair REX1-B
MHSSPFLFAVITSSFDPNRGLRQTLQSRNLSIYPRVCAEVTATFAVLSNTINTIRTILSESATSSSNNRSPDDKQVRQSIAELLQKLQQHEKAKLQWTAALHLDQIRSQSESHDERSVELIQRGIRDLQSKLASKMDEINEVTEELRCYLAEEDADE